MFRTRLDVELADPLVALRAVRDDAHPFALVGDWAGSRLVLGSEPVGGPADGFPAVDAVAGEGVGGGWFGALGFGLRHLVEELDAGPPRPTPLARNSMRFYDHVLRLDRDGEWWFEALVDDERVRARCAELVRRLRGPLEPRPFALDGMTPRAPGYAGHRAAVADCVARIHAGELFQANLCLRLDGRFGGSAADAFIAAASVLRPARGAFVDGSVLSFSPEVFLVRRGRQVETRPIKGTHTDRAALSASAKDRAENVMIVDLMRNDLGRVAAYGSVVASEPVIEPHPGLFHLVSTVSARLREDVDDRALLEATFPPGSVTGAPKVQALKVIAELEGTERETYTGAVGFVSPVAGLELNVAIRTLEIRGSDAWLGCGGGIVADSDPELELAEALTKARPILAALGAEVPSPGPPRPGRSLPAPALGPRPDPALGVIETMLVVDGDVPHLDRHLARLARALAPAPLAPDLAARVLDAAGGVPSGRARILVAGPEVAVSVSPEAPVAGVRHLLPVRLAGGLGPVKWADRRLADAYESSTHTPLFVDLDGHVLETGRANVWIVEGDAFVTPPADGRLLPGVTRELLLERHARVSEEPIELERLAAADGIFLTSSIRLASPADDRPASLAAAAAVRDLLAPRPRLRSR